MEGAQWAGFKLLQNPQENPTWDTSSASDFSIACGSSSK